MNLSDDRIRLPVPAALVAEHLSTGDAIKPLAQRALHRLDFGMHDLGWWVISEVKTASPYEITPEGWTATFARMIGVPK